MFWWLDQNLPRLGWIPAVAAAAAFGEVISSCLVLSSRSSRLICRRNSSYPGIERPTKCRQECTSPPHLETAFGEVISSCLVLSSIIPLASRSSRVICRRNSSYHGILHPTKCRRECTSPPRLETADWQLSHPMWLAMRHGLLYSE